MPRFSEYFDLKLSQHQLDFVDIDTDCDTPVYVDPYAIEVRNDEWAGAASESIRVFFSEVLRALQAEEKNYATNLMAHLHEPQETFLGVSQGVPKGRGVGARQAKQLINAISKSKAFETGMLSDLSEMALYVEGIDRDKISDLTTNIIRHLLVEYTKQQCLLFGIPVSYYSGPPLWDSARKNWVSREVHLPFIEDSPVLLVPKYIVRRQLSLNGQEFYNKQITDFLMAEHLTANSSLVQVIKGKQKLLKKDVREAHPRSKQYVAEFAVAHPEILELYKGIASRHGAMRTFNDDQPSLSSVCNRLVPIFSEIESGRTGANDYHKLVMGVLTALFYPNLILPQIEWEIHDGRKRIDIVFTNAGNNGFFAQRRDDNRTESNAVIVECKNYSDDIANPEIDQLLGRFDRNRGKFGIITCRAVDNTEKLNLRLRDAASRGQGYILVLTDEDLIEMLEAKANLDDNKLEAILFSKYRELLG
ncbi:hypothetical protein [Thalassospira lucentensis]|uniref:hypothetical protein n=1 Tax=Thalassospira lucentensis TaxID=168935 RepID=UPI0003B76974|nr:hypothetical protein [Thalassospira lucentensis]RCK23467.1 hypothetical protein TH1_16520 [Thalassospira lucentensis MCCC 1A00383 = DSM 14000]